MHANFIPTFLYSRNSHQDTYISFCHTISECSLTLEVNIGYVFNNHIINKICSISISLAILCFTFMSKSLFLNIQKNAVTSHKGQMFLAM